MEETLLLCASALAKDPGHRPATAQAFLEALEGRADLPQGSGRSALWAGLSLALVLVLGALALTASSLGSRGSAPSPPPTRAAIDSLEALLLRAYAGEGVGAADRAKLEAALPTLSSNDAYRRRVEFALALLRLEAGQDPLVGLRSLRKEERELARGVQRLQTPGDWRSLKVSAWVPRWEARARVRECTSLLSRRDVQQAALILRELAGAEAGESESDPARLSASRAALAPTPELLAELEGALDLAAVQALEEACAWAERGALRGPPPERPPVVRTSWRIGASAWRLECLLERPPRLPSLVAILANAEQIGRLYLPTEEHRQLQFEVLAPRDETRTVVNRGFVPQVSQALARSSPEHAPSLAALLSDQLVHADQDQLRRRGDELLGWTRSSAAEASIVHQNLGVAFRNRAIEGEHDEPHFLALAREHFRLARQEGHPNETNVVYQLGVVSMRLGDPSAAQAALEKFHDLSRINADDDDPWRGRRVFLVADCARLLAQTSPEAPAFSARAELAAEAGRRFLRLPSPGRDARAKRARSWHDGTQVLRAGLALWLAEDPSAKEVLEGALLDHRTPSVSKQEIKSLLAGGGSVAAAWGMLRNELKVASQPPYQE